MSWYDNDFSPRSPELSCDRLVPARPPLNHYSVECLYTKSSNGFYVIAEKADTVSVSGGILSIAKPSTENLCMAVVAEGIDSHLTLLVCDLKLIT